MGKKKIAKASMVGRSLQGKPAMDSASGPPDFNSKDYMTAKDGYERRPSIQKKVARTKINKAASAGADMPEGGNNSSNRSGAYPGV